MTEDTEGKPIKLSDYKGKVVMLDFWGTWCGPCMQMVPHNVETAKKYEGKQFVIIGVNSDRDKEKLAERIKAEKITYRSFWNSDKGAGGPDQCGMESARLADRDPDRPQGRHPPSLPRLTRYQGRIPRSRYGRRNIGESGREQSFKVIGFLVSRDTESSEWSVL